MRIMSAEWWYMVHFARLDFRIKHRAAINVTHAFHILSIYLCTNIKLFSYIYNIYNITYILNIHILYIYVDLSV